MRRRKHQLPRGVPTRLQLLVGFSVLVAIFVTALAIGLGKLLRDSIRDEAVSGAEQTGQLFAETEIGPEEYRGQKLAAATPGDLDTVVATSPSLRAARLWGPGGELVYSSDRGRRGDRSLDPGALRTAFRGTVASRLPNGGSSETPMKVFLPISLPRDRRPRSVLELDLPYQPIRTQIDERTKSMTAVLALGALLFYLALLPSVLRGSRALAATYQARQVPLQRRLRRAISNDELALEYQPKLDLATARVEGVEALLRWRLADGSVVPPADYIPLVEPTPVMEELTMHVFELAARQSATWATQDIHLDIAVNISACNLAEADLPDRLVLLTTTHGRTPADFTLEVTESAMSRRPDRDLHTLDRLRACGFKLSLDDFGTGESSLSRVQAIDFQEIKIDRSFVRDVAEQDAPVLVAGIIDLGHALGARVVAEGIESHAAARLLTELGCDAMQGFHLARPLPPEELADWLRARPASAAGIEAPSPPAYAGELAG